jgi:formylglycine-generating enzyme required for sulfatase activity/serine/threonine protein kinase
MPIATCPSDETLRSYARGGLPPESEDSLADHLDNCPRCETAVQTLELQVDPFLARLRAPVKPDPYQQEPECRRVVDRLLDDTISFGARPASSAPAALPPLKCPGPFREYDLLEILGEGGMGTVYKARHRKLNKLAAIKILPPGMARDPERVARFKREMKAIGQLDHTHIVRALDAGEAEGRHYLALEYVEGLDLSKASDRAGRLSVADACEVVRQVAVGLRAADEQGLIHRDIKPSNLMLTPKGQVKILDLGLAVFETDRPQHGETTAFGQIVGTPDYIAPEQINDAHSVDARADIYSLGCTLYKLLTGQAPFTGPRYKSHAEKLAAHLRDPMPSIRLLLPQAPEKLVALIDRMVVKDRDLRIPKPGLLVDELEIFCAGANLPALVVPPLGGKKDIPPKGGTTSALPQKANPEQASPNLPSPGSSAIGKDAKKSDFDPYHKWLGIPPVEQPPTHYRLLGLQTFETDKEVILGAVMRQSAHLKTFQLGQRAALTQKILNEVSAAKVCLLDPQRKAAYDDRLRKDLEAREKAARVETLPTAKPLSGTASAPAKPIPLGKPDVIPEAIPEAIPTEPVPIVETGLADLFSQIDSAAPKASSSAIGRKAPRPAAKRQSAASNHVRTGRGRGKSQVSFWQRCLAAIPPRYRTRGWLAAGGGAMGAVSLLLGIVIYVSTNYGTVKIELSDPSAKVTVKVDGDTVEIAGLKDPLTFKAGPHDLLVTSGEFKTVTQSFTVQRGENPVLIVHLEPDYGTIKIELSEPSAKVTVKVDRDTVETTGLKDPLKFKVGPHKLLVTSSEFKTVTQSFTVQRGENPVLIVRIEPNPIPPSAIAPFDGKKAKEHQQAWAKHLGVPVVQTNSIGMNLVLIPPGEFMMGSTKELIEEDLRSAPNWSWLKSCLRSEVPQHRVRITKPYRLGATEVTQEDYERVMRSNPSKHQGNLKRPVDKVSCDDAVEFCRRLSELREEKAAKRRYALPTEAQWEYACRAGTTTRWYSGNDEAGLADFAWNADNGAGQTHVVAQKRSNAWGLYDMHGNVHEWCQDCFDEGYYAKSPLNDPTGPPTGSVGVRRGGPNWGVAMVCRSAFRAFTAKNDHSHDTGFRVAVIPADENGPENVPPAPIPSIAPREFTNSLGMTLLFCPSGSFTMGSPQGENGREGNEEQVPVTISKGFYLGKYSVTQAEFKSVMGVSPWTAKSDVREAGDYPATYVDWNEATDFCGKLTASESQAGKLPQGYVYALPTGAQREYACRAGTTSAYSFGGDASYLGEYAWWGGQSGDGNCKTEKYAHRVGQKKPNPWGFYDLHGNVWEWCRDYYQEKLPGGTDPLAERGSLRVYRGGCWRHTDSYCRSATRLCGTPGDRNNFVGFRVALVQAETTRPKPPDIAPSEAQLLWAQIDFAKKDVNLYKREHVIFGKVVLDPRDNPSNVTFQSPILDNGIFASPTKDLTRPVGFRMHQYAPYDLDLTGKVGDVVDVGEVRMRRLSPNELVPLKGKLVLEGGGDPSQARIALNVGLGSINTPSNGYRQSGTWWSSIVSVGRSGSFGEQGFSPVNYDCNISATGYVSRFIPINFQPRVGADLGTISLEKQRHLSLEYIVSQTGPFDINDVKRAALAGGDRWQATPGMLNWDLQFKQEGGRLFFVHCYFQCYMADLGKSDLKACLNVGADSAKVDPGNIAVQDGHVYLLRSSYQHRNVLFRVSLSPQEVASGDGAANGNEHQK